VGRRAGQPGEAGAVGEERTQLVRQIGMARQQLVEGRGGADTFRVQVGGDHLIDLLFP
jgi:hypothetical protein